MEIREISHKKYKPANEQQKAEVQEKIKRMRKMYEKMRKGTFRFDDAQGGWFAFDYRYFPGDPIQIIKIAHGEVIDIPELLVYHINNTKRKVRLPLGSIELQGDYRRGEIAGQGVVRTSRISFIPMDSLEVPSMMSI